MSHYAEVRLVDGPSAGRLVPTVEAPVYGFCLEIERREGRFRRRRVDIYKVGRVNVRIVDPVGTFAEATYVGTLR